MGEVIEIQQKRVFSLAQAKELLPLIQRITKSADQEVRLLSAQFSFVSDDHRKQELEDKVQTIFNRWYEKVRKLGCQAKGMWLVDFDCGGGYYCWHFPEDGLSFFHGYSEGFRGRVKIQ